MSKDLKSLAEKYNSFTDFERIDIEAATSGEVIDAWFSNRPKEIDTLIETQWFNLEKLGIEVGNDERLRIKEGVISAIPEDETEKNLEYASEFISDYFSLVTEYIEHPDQIGFRQKNITSPEGWGLEEFLIGLTEERRF